MNINSLQIFIPLGGGVVFGITSVEHHLVVIDKNDAKVDLGPATNSLFEHAVEYLNRLKIHAKED